MAKIILLARIHQEPTQKFKDKLETRFGECSFIHVEPQTPRDLLDLVRAHNATAVVVHENPLAAQAMNLVPCIRV